MDTNCLKENYHGNSYNNAYNDVKNILSKNGFDNIQGSVYLGREGISEAHGTVAIQELTASFNWFYSCVSNIKFYRIESDLNAQFIADRVNSAKIAFLQSVEELRKSLEKEGITQDKIEKIINEQKFEFKKVTSLE